MIVNYFIEKSILPKMKSVRGFRKCGRLLGAFMKFLRNPGCGKRIRGEDFDKNKPLNCSGG